MIGALDGPWLLCAAMVLLTAVVARGPYRWEREYLGVAFLFVTALLARLFLGLWGPFHVNGQGPLWISGALDVKNLTAYGPGYFELFNWVTRLGGSADDMVFCTNAILSAITVPILYATARVARLSHLTGLLLALTMAVDPSILRTAASESYNTPITFLLAAALLCLVLAVRAAMEKDTLATGCALLAAALLSAAVARIHAMAYVPLALSPLVVFAVADRGNWTFRLALTAVAGATIGVVVILTSGAFILAALDAPMTDQVMQSAEAHRHFLLLGVLSIAIFLRRKQIYPWLAAIGVVAVWTVLATQNSFAQHVFQRMGYQRLFSPLILMALGGFFPRIERKWVPVVGAALVAAVLAIQIAPSLSPTTEQLEYAFLRKTLKQLPPGCTMAAIERAGNRLWTIPAFLLPNSAGQSGAALRLRDDADLDAITFGPCAIYVHSSLCTSREGRPLCERVENHFVLEAIARETLPARQSYHGLPYDRHRVEVVVYRIDRRKLTGQDS